MADNQAQSNSSNNQGANGAQPAVVSAQPEWLKGLPNDLQANPALTRYKDLGTFARSHLGLESKIGKSVSLPGPETSDEDRAEFYKKLGRPEAADKYSFKLPDGLNADEKFVNGAREAFHKAGLSDSQANDLVGFFAAQSQAGEAAQAAEIDAGVAEVKKEWGHAYDANVAVAGRALAQLTSGENAIPGLRELITDPKTAWLGSNPAMIRLMHYLGQAMGEDSAIEGDEKATEEEQQTIKQKIAGIRADGKDAYNDANHPQHKARVAEVFKLYEQLAGEG